MVLFALGTLQAQNQLQYSSFDQLMNEVKSEKAHLVVLNFWATWCKPCVAELPDFELINKEFKEKKVEVILANLDFHSKTAEIVPAFIINKDVQSKVVHITDQDANDWIAKVDEKWTGSIPATIIFYKGEKKWFFEGQTDHETLKSIINKYIQ